MEKGKIKNINRHNINGTIADMQGRTISFNNSNIISRDKCSLRTGDLVWFERAGAHAAAKAINIRLC